MLITSVFPAEVNEPSGIPKSLGLGWRVLWTPLGFCVFQAVGQGGRMSQPV